MSRWEGNTRTDIVLLDGGGAVDGDLIVGLVTVLNAEIIIVDLQIQITTQQHTHREKESEYHRGERESETQREDQLHKKNEDGKNR